MGKFDVSSQNITIFLPEYGQIDRCFRNKGEAIQFLKKTYGQKYHNLRPRFETSINKRDLSHMEYSE